MNNLAQHIIEAKRLLNEIELLTACPSNTNKTKAWSLWVKLSDQVRAMGIDVESIEA